MNELRNKYTLKPPIPLPRIKSLPDLSTIENYDENINNTNKKFRPLSTYNVSDTEDIDIGTIIIKHNNFEFNKKPSDLSNHNKLVYENISKLQQIVLEEKNKKPYEDLESHYNILPKNKENITSSLPDLVNHNRGLYSIPSKKSNELKTEDIERQIDIEELFVVKRSKLTTDTFISPIKNNVENIESLSVKNSLLSLPNTQVFVDEEYYSDDSDEFLDTKYLNYFKTLSKSNEDIDEDLNFDLHFPSVSQTNDDNEVEHDILYPPKHANIKLKIPNITLNSKQINYDTDSDSSLENSQLINKNSVSEFEKIVPYVEYELQEIKSPLLEKKNKIQIFSISNNKNIENLITNENNESQNNEVIYATAEIYSKKLEDENNMEIKQALLLKNKNNKFVITTSSNEYENSFSNYDIPPSINKTVSEDIDGYLIPNSIRISDDTNTNNHHQIIDEVLEDNDTPPPLPARGYLIPKSHFLKPIIENSGIKLKTNEEHLIENQKKIKRSKLYDIKNTENRLELIRRLILCGVNINDDDIIERFHIDPMLRKPKFGCDIDVTIHQSGILCKVYENIEENEIYLILSAGLLKYGSNQQELLEINTAKIMNISAKKISHMSNKWSQVFEITYWHEESDDTRVLELATRDDEERDTWMMRILQGITSVFPQNIINHYTRAGWLCMKEDEDDTWTPCWMLINDDNMFYCVETDKLLKFNLLSIRSIVPQRMNGAFEKIGITIDFGDKIIHLQGNSEEDTKQWKNCLLIASKLNIKISQFGTDTLYEEIDDNGEFIIKPPPVPFRPHARKIHEEHEQDLEDLIYDDADNSTNSEDNYQTLKNTLMLKHIENTGNNMYISVHVGTFPSPIVMQIAIGPDTTAGEIQNRFGNMQNLRLQEYILNGSLRRPLQSKEKIFDTLLRWSEWDDIDRSSNTLVFASNQTYYKAKALMKPSMTMSGEIRFADPSNKYTKPYWLEYSRCKLRLYKQEISSEKLTEWNVNELLWYFGHETKRNVNSQWSITCIEKYNKPKRSKERPFFGYTIESCDEDYLLWCAAFMVGNITRILNNNDTRTRDYVRTLK